MFIYIFNKRFEQKQIQQEYLLSTVFRRHSPHISRLLLQHIITISYITKVQQPAVFNAEKKNRRTLAATDDMQVEYVSNVMPTGAAWRKCRN